MRSLNEAHALRIGVLGAAGIARQFVRDVAPSPAVRVVAIASRTEEKAQAFAAEHGIARWHASYEDLLVDPAIQAVYVPLPNSMHAEWAIKAAEAGKHVLCEKPLALSRAQAEAMFDAATRHGVMLLESYPYWFQPQTGALLSLLREVGEMRVVQASFGFTVTHPETNVRLRPELGGGALLDAGSYPLSLIRLVMGDAPNAVFAQSTWASSGVDMSTVAALHWADGRRAVMSCGMDCANHRFATLVGSEGTIETEYLNHTHDGPEPHPHGWQPSLLRVRRGIANSIPFESVRCPTGSGFRFSAEAFARVVRERDEASVARAARASIDIAAMLEAVAISSRLAQSVTLSLSTPRTAVA